MNKILLMGRLTRDVDLKYSNGAQSTAISKFSLAIPRRFKRDGAPDADFINCTAFGKTAENIANYFSKGRMIAIEGRLQIDTYQKDGVNQYFTSVIVEMFDFTGEKKEDRQHKETGNTDDFFSGEYLDDEDLPF